MDTEWCIVCDERINPDKQQPLLELSLLDDDEDDNQHQGLGCWSSAFCSRTCWSAAHDAAAAMSTTPPKSDGGLGAFRYLSTSVGHCRPVKQHPGQRFQWSTSCSHSSASASSSPSSPLSSIFSSNEAQSGLQSGSDADSTPNAHHRRASLALPGPSSILLLSLPTKALVRNDSNPTRMVTSQFSLEGYGSSPSEDYSFSPSASFIDPSLESMKHSLHQSSKRSSSTLKPDRSSHNLHRSTYTSLLSAKITKIRNIDPPVLLDCSSLIKTLPDTYSSTNCCQSQVVNHNRNEETRGRNHKRRSRHFSQ